MKRKRLSVFRSHYHIYGQIIDEEKNHTLVSFSDLKLSKNEKAKFNKIQIAKKVGEKLGEVAKKAKITSVYFDRGKYKFHGRVKALAEGARKHLRF